MKLLKDYSIHVVTESTLLKRVLSHLIHHLGSYNFYFYDDLRTLVSGMRRGGPSRNLIFLDMPYHLEELRLYSDKLGFIPIFIMQRDGRNPTVNVIDCLKAVSQLREKVSHLGNLTDAEPLYIENTDETPKASPLENIFESLDMEHFLQLDLYLHPLSKPLTLCSLAQSLIPVLTDIDEDSFAIPLRFIKPLNDTEENIEDSTSIPPMIASLSHSLGHHSAISPLHSSIKPSAFTENFAQT